MLSGAAKLDVEDNQKFLSLRSLRHRLPTRMGGLDVSISPLAGMLAALNTAAEFYFATSSSTVEVVFPFPVSDDDRASQRFWWLKRFSPKA